MLTPMLIHLLTHMLTPMLTQADHIQAAKAVAELEGVTFKPRISAMAAKLKRGPAAAPWCVCIYGVK